MFEEFLNTAAENPFLATIIVLVSSVVLFLVCVKPLLYWLIDKTQTKKDDEIVNALFKAIEEHKEEVDAIHKVAKKVQDKKCKK